MLRLSQSVRFVTLFFAFRIGHCSAQDFISAEHEAQRNAFFLKGLIEFLQLSAMQLPQTGVILNRQTRYGLRPSKNQWTSFSCWLHESIGGTWLTSRSIALVLKVTCQISQSLFHWEDMVFPHNPRAADWQARIKKRR